MRLESWGRRGIEDWFLRFGELNARVGDRLLATWFAECLLDEKVEQVDASLSSSACPLFIQINVDLSKVGTSVRMSRWLTRV